MYQPFEQMPEHSRIWIYPCNRKFSEEEKNKINQLLTEFCENWQTHGSAMVASFNIVHDRFIIVAADQEVLAASGCAIDKQVVLILQIEKELDVVLLDKMNVTYKTGEFFAHKSLVDFKRLVKEKAVNAETIVYNNLVNNIAEWHDNWEIPMKDSWHSRFL